MHKQRVEYFKVKCSGIPSEGNTWEPAAHFVGDASKAVLTAFRQARADDMNRKDQSCPASGETETGSGCGPGRRKRSRQGDSGGGGDGSGSAKGGTNGVGLVDDEEVTIEDDDGVQKKHRQNRSDVWKFFFPRYWDANGPSGKGYYAKCRLCHCLLKVLNTTNLRGHLDKRHAGHMVEDAQTGKKVRSVRHNSFTFFSSLTLICFTGTPETWGVTAQH
jgi:hypothetical protein